MDGIAMDYGGIQTSQYLNTSVHLDTGGHSDISQDLDAGRYQDNAIHITADYGYSNIHRLRISASICNRCRPGGRMFKCDICPD